MARKAPLNWGVKDMPMPKEKNWPGASGRRVEKVEARVRKMEKGFGKMAKQVEEIAKGGNLKAVVDALKDIAKAIREPLAVEGGATPEQLNKMKAELTKNTEGIVDAQNEET